MPTDEPEDETAVIAEALSESQRDARVVSAVLEVRDLDVSYGPVQVLFGLDLDVYDGEIVALLGTNGAGKSTLFKAITGLLTPKRGTVRFAGRGHHRHGHQRGGRARHRHDAGRQERVPDA